MPRKRKINGAVETDSFKAKQLKSRQQAAQVAVHLSSRNRVGKVAKELVDLTQEHQEPRNHDELNKDLNKQTDVSWEQVIRQKATQGLIDKAKQVEGYYSNDDVTILLDGLLRRAGFIRISNEEKQDIVKDLYTGRITKTMVLAPIAENSKEAVTQLVKDIIRACNNNVKQILIPINIPNIHWYTLQLHIFSVPNSYALVATIHDSLGIRKGSVIAEQLLTLGLPLIKCVEGWLPRVQRSALGGSRNVYCGGYTARLIANLALNDAGVATEEAWGCPDNRDHILRQEDVNTVNEYNHINAKNFGKEAVAESLIMQAAENVSLIREVIAKEKESKLLRGFEEIYPALALQTKELIKSINIPENPAEISVLVRNLYAIMPSLLKELFETNALGEIEKDARGLLKLDTTIEMEQIRKIIIEFQKKCFSLEGIEAESTEVVQAAAPEELVNVEQAFDYWKYVIGAHNGNHPHIARACYNMGVAYHHLGDAKQALYYLNRAFTMSNALHEEYNADILDYLRTSLAKHSLGMWQMYQGNYPNVACALNNEGVAYQNVEDALQAFYYLGHGSTVDETLHKSIHPDYNEEQALKMMQSLYKGDHPDVAASLNNVGVAYEALGEVRKGLVYKEQALKMMQSLYKGDHPDVAASLNNVGVAYEALGEVRKGLDYYEQALKMMQSIYKDDHPYAATLLDNMCATYKRLGNQKKARDYHERAEAMKRALEEANRQQQESKEEFKGYGTLSYASESYYEYYNTALDTILSSRLSIVYPKVKRLNSWYLGGKFASVDGLVYKLSLEFATNDRALILVPANLHGKHWLGLLFRKLGAVVEVIYMDSEQRPVPSMLKSELENGLSRNGYKNQFLELRLEQQRYNNCGPELIENFAYYLTGTRATQEGAVYMHSLLVENGLLNLKEYGLKIEENNKLIGFLSNAQAVGIKEIALFEEQDHKWEERLVLEDLNERSGPDDSSIKFMLLKVSIGFKTLDVVIDSARLAQVPNMVSFKKLVLNYAYLHGMVSGVNSYSVMVGGAEAVYQLQLGEYQKAFDVAAGAISAMTLPVILTMANRPYLGIAYGAWIAVCTAYAAMMNAYSFALELKSDDSALISTMAYKDLTEWLATSSLQSLHDFGAKVKEYKLKINDLLFEKEKSKVEAKMGEKGEFGQKIFDYIYLPMLLEKYSLLNDVIRGTLTEEEAQGLKTKHVVITSLSMSYEDCMEIKTMQDSEYYCYNLEDQVLDHIALTAEGGITVIEHF